MPSPVLIVGGVIIAVGAGFAFKQFVYDPYISDHVQLWAEEFSQRRANRHARLAEPHSASPTPRGRGSPTDFTNEKRGSIDDNAGSSTGAEMRHVPSFSADNDLRRRATPFQRDNTDFEMGLMGMEQSLPVGGIDSVVPSWKSYEASDAARQLTVPTGVRSPPPPVVMPTPPATNSPRSPFSDIRALSEISFDTSSSDRLEYQFSPEVHAFQSPAVSVGAFSPPALLSPPITSAATFSPFVLPLSPPSTSADPFVDVRAPTQRPTSPWSELSAHSAATAGQLHLRLSRTDSDSEQDRRSDSGSDGSWEHT